MQSLPHHLELTEQIANFFMQDPRIEAAFLSGSAAKGSMDYYSDLDFGFLVTDPAARESIWSQRLEWKIAPWFHRFEADHVKPYFMIYLFEPHIHVDLLFYTEQTLPTIRGAPFVKVWDRSKILDSWLAKVNQPQNHKVAWNNVIHEEDRFWGWIHYSWCHTGRGEYYDDATSLVDVRKIVEAWHARLHGEPEFSTRRLEQRESPEFLEQMSLTFPKPTRDSLKQALLRLIQIHNQQRKQLDQLLSPAWATTQEARNKITALVEAL